MAAPKSANAAWPGRGKWAAGGPHQHAAFEQGAGLAAVHVTQLGFAQGATNAGQVHRLAAGHAGVPGGTRQQRHQARLQRRRDAGVGRQHLKGQRLHRVAGQHGLGLPVAHVHGGLATAQHVVVHAGHVVVHQRIGVDQFHRHGRTHRGGTVTGHGLTGRQHQQGRRRLPPSSTP
jgi:hypothetical protein